MNHGHCVLSRMRQMTNAVSLYNQVAYMSLMK